jgi:hypothetical protein
MWRASALNLNRPADIRSTKGPGVLRRIASILRRYFVVASPTTTNRYAKSVSRRSFKPGGESATEGREPRHNC